MGKVTIKDYIQLSNLGVVFQERYAGKPGVRGIINETGLPAWFVYELAEQGLVSDDKVIDNETLVVLNTALYCFRSHRFLRNALNRVGKKKRARLLRRDVMTSVDSWLYSRIETYLEEGRRVVFKDLYVGVKETFPKYFDLVDVEKYNSQIFAFRRRIRLYKQRIKRLQKKRNHDGLP